MILPIQFDIGEHKKLVVIGEAGSGKTELSVNLALSIREMSESPVTFCDMDQTKPLFRARDIREYLCSNHIAFPIAKQFMDAPVVPHGMKTMLTDPASYTILDVGGNKAGALCLGQYASMLKQVNTLAFYTINPYRCFSDTSDHIWQTMQMVLACCRLEDVRIICNPYIGPDTTKEDLEYGMQRLREILRPLQLEIYATLIPACLWDLAGPMWREGGRYFKIAPYMPKVLDLFPVQLPPRPV